MGTGRGVEQWAQSRRPASHDEASTSALHEEARSRFQPFNTTAQVIQTLKDHRSMLLRSAAQIGRAMSTATIATLPRMSAETLSRKILQEGGASEPTFAVVDVRDNDHIGGHIRGSINMPSNEIDVMMPIFVPILKDKKTVVFHCALSQQRGPSAALLYLRERDVILDFLGQKRADASPQDVFVLDRGFVGWQEAYGTDKRLTENYDEKLWK